MVRQAAVRDRHGEWTPGRRGHLRYISYVLRIRRPAERLVRVPGERPGSRGRNRTGGRLSEVVRAVAEFGWPRPRRAAPSGGPQDAARRPGRPRRAEKPAPGRRRLRTRRPRRTHGGLLNASVDRSSTAAPFRRDGRPGRTHLIRGDETADHRIRSRTRGADRRPAEAGPEAQSDARPKPNGGRLGVQGLPVWLRSIRIPSCRKALLSCACSRRAARPGPPSDPHVPPGRRPRPARGVEAVGRTALPPPPWPRPPSEAVERGVRRGAGRVGGRTPRGRCQAVYWYAG